MAQKNRYKAKVGGQTYTIIGQESKQHMDVVMHLINEQLDEISALSTEIDKEQAAILLAINAVSDQVKKQEEIIKLQKKLAELEVKLPELEKQVAYTTDLENRVKKIEAVEQEAKEILRKNGQEDVEIKDHVQAQQIVNEERKKTIKNTTKK